MFYWKWAIANYILRGIIGTEGSDAGIDVKIEASEILCEAIDVLK